MEDYWWWRTTRKTASYLLQGLNQAGQGNVAIAADGRDGLVSEAAGEDWDLLIVDRIRCQAWTESVWCGHCGVGALLGRYFF